MLRASVASHVEVTACPLWRLTRLQVPKKHTGDIFVVPYLAHRYITDNETARPPQRRRALTFVGAPRDNGYRKQLTTLANLSNVHIGMEDKFSKTGGSQHHTAAQRYSFLMMASTYCLVLPGDTITSRRLFDAILAGCVPVIVTGEKPGDGKHAKNPQLRRLRKTMSNLPFSVRSVRCSSTRCNNNNDITLHV